MAKQRFMPNVSRAIIATANPNLDGSGAVSGLINGTADGTIVETITIAAQGPTSQGMIRIFLSNGSTIFLLQEIMVPANIPTGVVPAFSATVDTKINLENGYYLLVSTEQSEQFSVTAFGLDFVNCGC